MAQLIKIGKSRGVRIPKVPIEEAHLAGRELNFQVLEDGLMILPSPKPREGWAEAIQASQSAHGAESVDDEWLDSPLVSSSEWEW